MSEEQVAAQENAPVAQPDDVEIVAAEKQEGAPEGQVGQQPMILGKFKSPDDLAKAYAELEKAYGRSQNELGTYRQQVEQRPPAEPARPVQGYGPQYDPERVNEEFRAQLERDPFGTLMNFAQMVSNQTYEQRMAAQRESFQRFQQHASDPFFSDVAQDAAQMLAMNPQPLSPEEGVLLKAKIARLQSALRDGGNYNPAPPPAVEGAGGQRPSAGIRVELDDDRAVRFVSSVGEDRAKKLARMVAKQKQAGKSTGTWSIDDWEAANA